MKNIFGFSALVLACVITVTPVNAQNTVSLKTVGYQDEELFEVKQTTSTDADADADTNAPNAQSPVVRPTEMVSAEAETQNCETPSLKTIHYCYPENTKLPVSKPVSNIITPPQARESALPALKTIATPPAALVLDDPSSPATPSLSLVEPTSTPTFPEPSEPSMFNGMRFFISGEGGLSLPSLSGRSTQVRWANINNDLLTLDKETTSWNPTGSYDLGYHLGARSGIMLNNGLYAAIDGMYRYQLLQNSWTNTVNSVNYTSTVDTKVNTVATFLTGGFTLSDMGIFRPFAEVSVGYALNTASAIVYNTEGTNPRTEITRYAESDAAGIAYGVSVGSGIMLTNNMEARLGYRYRNFGAADTEGGLTSSHTNTRVLIGTLDAHELYAGVSFYF